MFGQSLNKITTGPHRSVVTAAITQTPNTAKTETCLFQFSESDDINKWQIVSDGCRFTSLLPTLAHPLPDVKLDPSHVQSIGILQGEKSRPFETLIDWIEVELVLRSTIDSRITFVR